MICQLIFVSKIVVLQQHSDGYAMDILAGLRSVDKNSRKKRNILSGFINDRENEKR
jgi:hypothetical protein